ncbi:MAG: hypothetical protein P9X24_01735 [Candidatus Hatepunaea meridiana]|nr:hypothetical protein [Candidatus Hatepunaea meridiana]
MKKTFLVLLLLLLVSCGPGSIKIVQPTNNAQVNGIVSVSGKCRGVSNVYIYAYSNGLKSWTFQSEASVTSGRFNARAWLGEDDEQDTEYTIVALSGEFNPDNYKSRDDLKGIPYEKASEPVRVIRN